MRRRHFTSSARRYVSFKYQHIRRRSSKASLMPPFLLVLLGANMKNSVASMSVVPVKILYIITAIFCPPTSKHWQP
ncbi:hypothetical protein Y032_0079g1290 [Ancylostoma ceylanicum]|uniref:Uncharacterized protein n=1 Tax=Ancylostoma ceylanicum TaxID=53326 RepID=A0A016TUB3_9BILA|nr:hypothetical protein Y032_0079g1290 [Ancylostoma ceylanicum]